jgi:hypothetical protein
VSAKQALAAAQSSSDKALSDLKAQMAQAEVDKQASGATQVSRLGGSRCSVWRLPGKESVE